MTTLIWVVTIAAADLLVAILIGKLIRGGVGRCKTGTAPVTNIGPSEGTQTQRVPTAIPSSVYFPRPLTFIKTAVKN